MAFRQASARLCRPCILCHTALRAQLPVTLKWARPKGQRNCSKVNPEPRGIEVKFGIQTTFRPKSSFSLQIVHVKSLGAHQPMRRSAAFDLHPIDRALLSLRLADPDPLQPEIAPDQSAAFSSREHRCAAGRGLAARHSLCRRCFEPLSRAYVEARYSSKYTVSNDELQWLVARLKDLQTLAETILQSAPRRLKPNLRFGVLRSSGRPDEHLRRPSFCVLRSRQGDTDSERYSSSGSNRSSWTHRLVCRPIGFNGSQSSTSRMLGIHAHAAIQPLVS